MSHSRPNKSRSKPNRVQRFLRWLFGTPFEDLGEPFGGTVPPEIRKFEAESEEIAHLSRGTFMPQGEHHTRSNPSHK